MMIQPADQPMAVLLTLVMWVGYEYMVWRRDLEMAREFVGVPLRSSLRVIVRTNNMWIVWMGVDDMQVPYEQWRGTCIRLHDNGTAYRVVIQPDGTEDVLRIK